VRPEGLSVKNSSDTVGNRIRDFLAKHSVPQLTAVRRTDTWTYFHADDFMRQGEWKTKGRRKLLAKTCYNELLNEICPASLTLIPGYRGINITCKYVIFSPFRKKISTSHYWFLDVCLTVRLSTLRLRNLRSL
jgi:hypothetical protein